MLSSHDAFIGGKKHLKTPVIELVKKDVSSWFSECQKMVATQLNCRLGCQLMSGSRIPLYLEALSMNYETAD